MVLKDDSLELVKLAITFAWLLWEPFQRAQKPKKQLTHTERDGNSFYPSPFFSHQRGKGTGSETPLPNIFLGVYLETFWQSSFHVTCV